MEVLIVEIDDMLRDTLQWLLESAGYRCASVPDAGSALDWLRQHPGPSLVMLGSFLDMTIPDPRYNGTALLHAVHQDDAFWGTHVVLCLVRHLFRLPGDISHILTQHPQRIVLQPFGAHPLGDAVAESVTDVLGLN